MVLGNQDTLDLGLGLELKLLSSVPNPPKLSEEEAAVLDNEIDHATGLERLELIWKKKGIEPFGPPMLSGPFGTPENPCEVPSFSYLRFVGCTGTDGMELGLRYS